MHPETDLLSKSNEEFRDEFSDLMKGAADLSDQDLERLLSGGSAAPKESLQAETLKSGTRVNGVVVEVRNDEILVELDGKNLGVIELDEFRSSEAPQPGETIAAEFIRYDALKEVSMLSTQNVRKEILWDELRVGQVVQGTVVETNKGGLTLSVHGERAFLPISQIALERVDDLDPYVNQKLTCEVTQFDRSNRNLVISRRNVLEREMEAQRDAALAALSEGEVITGTIRRITEHGAFVDIGGVDGLLHASKIHRQVKTSVESEPLREGQKITVEIASVDPERGRVGLDFHQMAGESWEQIVETYSEGDIVTGWVARVTTVGALVHLDEGLETLVPLETLNRMRTPPSAGSILRVRLTTIDRNQKVVLVEPIE